MIFPCNYNPERFGYEYLDVVKKNGIFYCYHPGVDFNCGVDAWGDEGEPIHAIADGVVVFAGWATGWGNLLVIKHPQLDLYTRHGHLLDITVKVGDKVTEGQITSHLGNTGNSSAPHLHFDMPRKEIRWTSYTRLMSKIEVKALYADPMKFIGDAIKKELEEKGKELFLHDWKDKNGKNISKEAWEWITEEKKFISRDSHPQEKITNERFGIILKRIHDPLEQRIIKLEKKLDDLYSKFKQ